MSTLLAPMLQYFFTEHLTTHRQVSPRTIVAYRDSIFFPRCGSARSGQRRCRQSRACHPEETHRQAAGWISDT